MLGYLKQHVDLSDIRKKPFILSKSGFDFLYYLSVIFSKYLRSEKQENWIYEFENIIEQESSKI